MKIAEGIQNQKSSKCEEIIQDPAANDKFLRKMKFTKPSPLIEKRIEVKDGSFLDKNK